MRHGRRTLPTGNKHGPDRASGPSPVLCRHARHPCPGRWRRVAPTAATSIATSSTPAAATRCWCCPRAPPTSTPSGSSSGPRAWFDDLGATVRPRPGADPARRPRPGQRRARSPTARFIYLAGASPMHLRSVLKDSPVWDALVAAWQGGAVLAGSSAGAMVLCDPMVDPRGGAFTARPRPRSPSSPSSPTTTRGARTRRKRTLKIAPAGLPLVGIDERSALIRQPDGRWTRPGAGRSPSTSTTRSATSTALPSGSAVC